MERLAQFSVGKQIAFILAVFVFWSAASMAWYVCGVRNLCAIQAEAHNIAHDDDAITKDSLSATQAPLMVVYDRAGAAGEIFVMLLIAFVLGSLLGRILAAPKTAGQVPLVLHLPNVNKKLALAERIGVPTHVSAFTKKTASVVAAASAPTQSIAPVSAANKPILMPAPLEAGRETRPRPLVGPAPLTTANAFHTLSATKPAEKSIEQERETYKNSPERPKIRFNTSWSNPYRGKESSNT